MEELTRDTWAHTALPSQQCLPGRAGILKGPDYQNILFTNWDNLVSSLIYFSKIFFLCVGNWLDDLSLCSDMCQHLNYHIPSHLSGSPSSLWWTFKTVLTRSLLYTLSFFGEMKINTTCGILIVSLPIISERPLLFFSASVGLSHETTSFNRNDSLLITQPCPQVPCDVTVSSLFLPASVSCLGKPTKCFSYILTQFLKEV